MLITGTAKVDKIKETLDDATIQTFGGKDVIRSYGDDVLIDAGAGNDTIRNDGDATTPKAYAVADASSRTKAIKINGNALKQFDTR